MLLGSQVVASTGEVRPAYREIRVCHIASGDLWAGAEAQTATLVSSLKNAGVAVILIVLNEGRLAEEARKSNVEVKVIPEGRLSFRRVVLEATDLVRQHGINVLHSHRYKENLLAAIVARRCNIRVVIRTQHGLPEPFSGTKGRKHMLTTALDSLVARFATSKIISVSSELTETLTKQLEPNKIVTIVNGIELKQVFSKLTREQAKDKLGIPPNRPIFGCAGRLESIKRVDLFLCVAQLLAGDFPLAQFVIVGDGSKRQMLEKLSRRLGLHDRVLFLGHRDDIYDVLRAMDIFVMCSDHEGMPMILLEALAMKVPVVARAVGGICEVLQDGLNGTLIRSAKPEELALACRSVLRQPETVHERISDAGRATVIRNFSADKSAASVLQLYRTLLESR